LTDDNDDDDGVMCCPSIRVPKKHLTFNVQGSVHRNNIIVYKSQQDVHVT